VRQDIQNLHVEYSVDVSPNDKFPDSPNPFERSIRDHVVLNAEYKGLTPELQQYIAFAKEKNFLPRFPPVGTKMDTSTGAEPVSAVASFLACWKHSSIRHRVPAIQARSSSVERRGP
jgi:hypothetical protein